MELLEIYAEPYWRLASNLGLLIARLEYTDYYGISVPDDFSRNLGTVLGEMKRELEKLELKLPLMQFHRLEDYIASNPKRGILYSTVRHHLVDLLARILDDLQSRLFIALPESMMGFYEQKEPLFGKQVEDKFPNMSEDISEAGKCIALWRSTASVFHLMRIMEIAVQQFGDKLGVKLVQETNWQVILDQINAAIKKMDSKDKKTVAYAQAASHLYNVKVSWRNNVMHPKQTYTPEEARTIFDNVKTFICDIVDII